MELQNQLQQKYAQIEDAIKALDAINAEQYKTSGCFRYNPTNSYSSVDLSTVTNQAELINVYSFIKVKKQQYEEAAEEIGLSEYPLFKWCGYTAEDWLHDVKLRFKLIKYDGRLAELKAAKNKIQPYLPKDTIIGQLLLEMPEMELPF